MTLEQLQSELASMLHPLDIPGSWTQREVLAYEAKRAALDARIRTVRHADSVLAEWRLKWDADVTHKPVLLSVREKLREEGLAVPPRPTGIEWGKLRNVQLSLRAIEVGLDVAVETGWSLETLRLGQLLREAGVGWRGTLPEVQRRIDEAKAHIEDAETRRTNALSDDV